LALAPLIDVFRELSLPCGKNFGQAPNFAPMVFLHTSDWHLGQKLLYKDRDEEHRLALQWLRGAIVERHVDALIVAGDIFDIGNPPHSARRMYYDFLSELIGTPCRHIIIVGGNHDSPAMLEAPAALLRAFNVRVLGAARETLAEQILELRAGDGRLEAVVAAVPFLRDRDLRQGVAGETSAERIARIRAAIRAHYETLAQVAAPYKAAGVPALTTGHLYAKDAYAAERQNNIYIGDQENIAAEDFPAVFDYVALGHLHRAQMVGGQWRVRYSGSLIPLSFSETQDDKGCYLIEFAGAEPPKIEFISAPVFRRLKTISGSWEEVKTKLERFAAKEDRRLTPWVEIVLQTGEIIPRMETRIQEFTAAMPLEVLKIRLRRLGAPAPTMPEARIDLSLLEDHRTVFRQRCTQYGCTPEELAELETSFQELFQWMREREAS
jgi:exonuclease SbcD